jgi:predicted outer membrane repeat protein
MRSSLKVIFVLFLISSIVVHADTIHVPANQPTIQAGIDAAMNGDIVLVAPGTYTENIDFLGKAITVKSTEGAEKTIIDGAQSGAVVIFLHGEDENSVLDGFTLTNGTGHYFEHYPGYWTYLGGAVFMNGSSPSITNNTISLNSVDDLGGGICCWSSCSPIIKNNTISENTALTRGGGICCFHESAPVIECNTITNNIALDKYTSYGGGMYFYNSSPTILDNILIENTADDGGGIHCTDSPSTITNNIFKKNLSDIEGGAICLLRSDTTLKCNTFTNNISRFGGGVYCFTSDIEITDNIFNLNKAHYQGGGLHWHGCFGTISDNKIISNSSESDGGGGIYCTGGLTEINILNNIIIYNTGGGGGGIHCQSISPTIGHNLISKNSSPNYNGGGIYFGNCDAILISNIISENRAKYGGGIKCDNSTCLITNNLFECNWSGMHGGAVDLYKSSSGFMNNVLAGNSTYRGGGYFLNMSNAVILNDTVINNSAHEHGGGFFSWESSTMITNTIFWDNVASVSKEICIDDNTGPSTMTISYSNVEGGQTYVYVKPGCTLNWGPGMINTDPLFVDTVNNDFHLTFNSPCRDTGDSNAVSEPYDIEGDPRIAWGGTVDMGADEFYTHLYITGMKTPGGSIEGKLVGIPGSSPTGIFIGNDVLETPLSTSWGKFYLNIPWLLIPLIPIPADGVLKLPATIPLTPYAPYDLYMQALIDLNPESLTNVEALNIRKRKFTKPVIEHLR